MFWQSFVFASIKYILQTPKLHIIEDKVNHVISFEICYYIDDIGMPSLQGLQDLFFPFLILFVYLFNGNQFVRSCVFIQINFTEATFAKRYNTIYLFHGLVLSVIQVIFILSSRFRSILSSIRNRLISLRQKAILIAGAKVTHI